MKINKINVMGMEMIEICHKSCRAEFGFDDSWATLFSIESHEEGKGHATELLQYAKEYFKDKKFGGSVALNPTMKHIYKKLNIEEYTEI
jgi:predicted metal-binding protein